MKPVLEFFSSDEIYQIHQTSLEILERVGMKFESPEAQQILKDAGVEVDSKVARFHSDLVEDYIKMAPRSVVLRGRDPKKDVFLRNEGGKSKKNEGCAGMRVLNKSLSLFVLCVRISRDLLVD